MKPFSGVERKEILNLGLFTVSLVPVLLFIFVVVQRIGLPFDLEWGEGAGINQIYRILSDEQLYSEPTLEFTALVYTPFYYWLASIMGRISKGVVLAARILSLLASLGTFGIIAWVITKKTGQYLIGWLASALYIACFALSDGFYDLVRVDSLYVFILLLSFTILRFRTKTSGLVVAGLSIALGFFTKQSTLIVFIPLVVYLLVHDWKSTWPILPAIILGIFIPFYLLNVSSGGWFNYYILRLPQEHGYSFFSAINFWTGDLLGPMGIAVGFGMFYCLEQIFGKSTDQKDETQTEITDTGKSTVSEKAGPDGLFSILFAAGAIGTAWITRSSNGGGANNVMPAYAAVALLFGLGLDKAIRLISTRGINKQIYSFFIASVVAVQFIGLLYNPFKFIPTDGEIIANEMLVEQIREIDDPPWIPYRSQLSLLAGKTAQVHAVNLFELTGYFRGEVLPEGKALVEEIRANLCSQSYGMVMLDQPIPWVSDQLSLAYQSDSRFSFLNGESRSELLDWQGGFQAYYLPREEYDLSKCLETIGEKGNQ